MFGTNDSKHYQWNQEDYMNDYRDLIKSFVDLDSKPQVHVMVPPPLYQDGFLQMDSHVINELYP